MSFKIHLLIVTFIILAVTIIWEFKPDAVQLTDQGDNGEISRRIIVNHASWGLNCLQYDIESSNRVKTPYRTKESKNKGIFKDNAYKAVALACNGELECEVRASDEIISPEPEPNCQPKSLDIEYRCFSYDRPWRVQTEGGTVKLECTKE